MHDHATIVRPASTHAHDALHPDEGLRRQAAIVSVVVGFAMLAGKWLAFSLTGSHAILSDALESVVHIAATAFALFSLIVASRPPDERFPYGYGKIGYFSAGFEGGLIALAGVAILFEAVRGLVDPRPLTNLEQGLALILAASLINLALGLWLIRRGKRTGSLILEADGHHVLSDSVTSFGVVAGVALVKVTGWRVLDPLIAMAVGLPILRTGAQLVRRAFQGLMDRADPSLLEHVVAALRDGRPDGWLDVHQLRAWQSGDRTFVDFHLVVPSEWTVGQLHDAHVEARERIRRALRGPVESIIHFDPFRPERGEAGGEWTVASAIRHPSGESARASTAASVGNDPMP